MAFKANLSTLGEPDLGLIHIDPIEVAKAFQTYLHSASKLTGVSLKDIKLNVNKMPGKPEEATLVELLNSGLRLFDAIVWMTAGRPKEYPLKLDPAMKVESIPSLHNVARAVFYCYFMLIVQARYPVSKNETNKPAIPNFLRTIMGMDEEQHVYVERICTFEPQKFDPAWARYVDFKGFGRETLSRFGLGVAGYRYFGPFALYAPRPDLPANLVSAFEFAKTVASAPASWDVHPLTREPNVLTNRGNLNKNLTNLILDCFTEEQIAEMVAAKVIYGIPKREPNHRNYTQWKVEDDITGDAKIFPKGN
jgi:hypothetical protein